MIEVTFDGEKYKVPHNITILSAARYLGINIPTLCYMPGLEANGGCRLCVVEVMGARGLVTSCSTPVAENMVISTKSERVCASRKSTLDLLLSVHDSNCFACSKYGKCEFRELCNEYGLEKSSYGDSFPRKPIDYSNRFYTRDPNKCILCEKCVRVCKELQGNAAIWLSNRGYNTQVTSAFDDPEKLSECVSCGNCISVCPTGAIYPKGISYENDNTIVKTQTVCPYCGVGCKLNLHIKENKVVSVSPANGPANRGLLCVKGRFAYNFISHPDRLKSPYIRKSGRLVECTWEEALDEIKKAFTRIKSEEEYRRSNGISEKSMFAGLSSAKCTNEENYLFQKMMRSVFKTNNVDHCARLCHAPTVAGLALSFGSGAMTNSISEIEDMDVIFILGSNTTETHPVIASKMRQAKLKGATIIVAEPRKIDLCREANLFLQIEPGTNVALLNGLMKAVIDESLEDIDFISKRTECYEQLQDMISNITVEECADICKINPDDIRKAARLFATGAKSGIFYAMGVTQHTTGTEGVHSVANLAMLCGKIGKQGCGVNPLRGQNNVQGSSDMGAVPSDYPGYQKVAVNVNRLKFEQAWNTTLPSLPGKTLTEIIDDIQNDDIQFLYIMGENPLISDPDLNHLKDALKKLKFMIVQDLFMTETASLADVVLPAASFAEKEGTFTNTERRVQLIAKAIKPIGQAKEDWQIIQTISNLCGGNWEYKSSKQIMDEISSLVPIYGGISYERLNGPQKNYGLQWPCLDLQHKGTKILHTNTFTRGLGKFIPCSYKPPFESVDDEYCLILTTGRILYQYHTRTMTSKTDGIEEIAGENFVEMNELTAQKYSFSNGELISVYSRRGEINVKVRVSPNVKEHVVFMPFHYAKSAANILTSGQIDPIAKIPEFKVCAVGVRKRRLGRL